ncbi:DUF4383 domain-containing protein [Arthrobacter sp. NamB2]|uniref:DUF4383 domain-containing protein n=1 Tax=Arthrobacter sp. NamB2 TaxID=2576035 RepID=UPI0010C94E12|nr:DUF4383 domain-containing protein [Arthrobacter sp. NamB2]TKV29050.1 DUF4383 domain-containing protein [Arthrobacter sp. NamB2]
MTSTNNRTVDHGRTKVQRAAQAMGIVFLLVGILGFIPGITSDYDTMQFAGHTSEAKLLGIFQVSILHNIVHLLFGIAGLAMAKTVSGARNYLLGGGIIYAILWIYGLVIGQDSAANFVPLNGADNWLHFLLAVAMIALALLLTRSDRTKARA